MTVTKNIVTQINARQYIRTNAENLSITLLKAIGSKTLTYPEICEVDHQGIYIIFDNKTILYVGKTNRQGKVRMRELAADFRSHTFNRKLLSKRFRDLGFVFEVLKNETKKEWIDADIITMENFKIHQKDVNKYIKEKLKFKFYKQSNERKLISLEHFAIAILNPIHND